MTQTLPMGTQITCASGHPVCRTALELREDMAPDADDFNDWQIPAPRPHDLVEPCPCGAPFIDFSHGTRIHTDQGWWPRD